ncbi:MAG: o-succinylbenzoate synthase [Polyangiaceae bacterium]
MVRALGTGEPAVSLQLSLASTERALSRPAHNARQGWSTRAACVITLTGDDGGTGSGEASPLPGFSLETLSDCQAVLGAVDAKTLPKQLAPGQSLLEGLEGATRGLPKGVPAARSALECALLDLWARAAGKPAWDLIRAPNQGAPTALRVAALLQGEPEEACEQAQAAHARGVRCFKFKIGRAGALERELIAVRRLRATLGPQVQLRLDANQSLSAEQARVQLPRFAPYDIEYIEEPCTTDELTRLGSLALPVALDESLRAHSPFGSLPGVRALVLKPALLGGISACIAWAEAARRSGAEIILSHTFDGPLGLMLSAALALGIGSDASAHGLDLHGARLEAAHLPGFLGARLQAWSEPGFGIAEPAT